MQVHCVSVSEQSFLSSEKRNQREFYWCSRYEESVFREALQKTGVNISPILLRLKDRENAENDRNLTVDR